VKYRKSTMKCLKVSANGIDIDIRNSITKILKQRAIEEHLK